MSLIAASEPGRRQLIGAERASNGQSVADHEKQQALLAKARFYQSLVDQQDLAKQQEVVVEVPEGRRPLQPWQPNDGHDSCNSRAESGDLSTTCSMTSPMNLNVDLEDMLDAPGGHWDQFEVNERRFGVKSSFQDDLSQYTTKLQMSKIPNGVRHEAERIATEIEYEHKETGRPEDAGTAADPNADEEDQFSAVSRPLVQMQ